MRRPKILLVGSLLIALLLLPWLFKNATHRESSSRGEQERDAIDQNAPSSTPAQAPPPPLGAVESREAKEQRTEVISAGFWGSVVAQDGSPIADATVSWTVLHPLDLEWEPAWQDGEWGRLGRETTWTTTDSGGRFGFPQAPAADLSSGSVLWVTRTGFRANCAVLGPGALLPNLLIRLEPSPAIQALVETVSGEPIARAVVEHYGLVPTSASRGAERGLTEERARRFLWRSIETDASGRGEVAAFPGEQVLVAMRGDERSAPWQGPARRQVVLQVADGFTLGGRVLLPDWTHLNYAGERRIVVAARRGNIQHVLTTLRPIGAGPWGPVALPILADAHYTVRLEGSPIIPVEENFEEPSAGEHLTIDLRAELGNELWLVALNEEGETLFDAEAFVYWEEEGRLNFVRRRARSTDGYINPWSMPAGTVTAVVSAPGYAPWISNPIALPEVAPATYEAVLTKGGRVRGRCVHQGRPVEDFEVMMWPGEASYLKQSRNFRGRENGEFELEGAPLGNLLICASSEALPACEPKALGIEADQTSQVILELPEPLTGRGIVVDAETKEPISAAEVQLFVSAQTGPVAPWGSPWPVRQDGSFEVEGFAPGKSFLKARAPGYADLLVTAFARADEALDLGTIALRRPQELELQLTTTGGVSVDFSPYQSTFIGDSSLPTGRADSTGLIRLEDVQAGRRYLAIQRPDGPLRRLTLDLRPGEPWRFTHRVSGSRRLTVELLTDEANEPAKLGALYVHYTSTDGIGTLLGADIPGDGVVFLDGIDSESVTAEVRDSDSKPLANAQGSFEGRDDLHLTLQLSGEPFRVLVIDEEGQSIPGVLVRIIDSQPTSLTLTGTTDADGVCDLRGVPRRGVFVDLSHASRGSRFGIPCDGGAGEVELELTARGRLELEFLDGDAPVVGVTCRLLSAHDLAAAAASTSQPDGRVRWEGLTPGRYRISAYHPECWPVVVEVEAKEKEQTVPVQIRHLGGVIFEVRNRDGLPVVGQAIGMLSLEFDVDVAEWIEQERVSTETGLVTDSKGQVQVVGVPHGDYRFTCTGSEEPLDGVLKVPPGDAVQFPIVLP